MVMLLVVGAVTVAGRVMAMVDPVPVLVEAAPLVSDVQFAGAAQAAVFDYLSWDATAPRARRMTDLDRWGLTGAVSDGWDGSGELRVENAVASDSAARSAWLSSRWGSSVTVAGRPAGVVYSSSRADPSDRALVAVSRERPRGGTGRRWYASAPIVGRGIPDSDSVHRLARALGGRVRHD